MNQSTILLNGKISRASVFKDQLAKKPVQYPIQGDKGYAIQGHELIELVFNEQFQVWHKQGIDLNKFSYLFEEAAIGRRA